VEEKEKNKEKAQTKRGCWHYLLWVFLLFALGVSAFFYILFERTTATMQVRMAPRNCSGLPEAVEWTGVLDFIDAPASDTIINEENAARLTPIGISQLSALRPRFWLDEPIKHPQHNYILAFTMYDSGSWDITNDLTVCQQDGWSSHILSNYARSMAFTPNGQFFAVDYNLDAHIILYDAFSIEEIARIPLGDGAVQGFAFHPLETIVAILVNGQEEHLEIWNYKSLARLAQYNVEFSDADGTFVAFNTKGSLLAIHSYLPEETTIAWGIAPD
jgi:hypothetical protein